MVHQLLHQQRLRQQLRRHRLRQRQARLQALLLLHLLARQEDLWIAQIFLRRASAIIQMVVVGERLREVLKHAMMPLIPKRAQNGMERREIARRRDVYSVMAFALVDGIKPMICLVGKLQLLSRPIFKFWRDLFIHPLTYGRDGFVFILSFTLEKVDVKD